MKIPLPRDNSVLTLHINCCEPAHIRISNVTQYTTGFGFEVVSELDAMRAAYYYRYANNVRLTYQPLAKYWHVNVIVPRD